MDLRRSFTTAAAGLLVAVPAVLLPGTGGPFSSDERADSLPTRDGRPTKTDGEDAGSRGTNVRDDLRAGDDGTGSFRLRTPGRPTGTTADPDGGSTGTDGAAHGGADGSPGGSAGGDPDGSGGSEGSGDGAGTEQNGEGPGSRGSDGDGSGGSTGGDAGPGTDEAGSGGDDDGSSDDSSGGSGGGSGDGTSADVHAGVSGRVEA